ncbi:hypothetical protein [Cedecea davisae]|uniref:hypothetical protein n=1 Tax=Cedecea davisae TaxID=158484 RepID=UPI00243121C7|nr:hypothetical protein [Cedecea davisae]
MTEEQLIECLQIAGRYQVYSDGEGDYAALPLRDNQIIISMPSHTELSDAESNEVI